MAKDELVKCVNPNHNRTIEMPGWIAEDESWQRSTGYTPIKLLKVEVTEPEQPEAKLPVVNLEPLASGLKPEETSTIPGAELAAQEKETFEVPFENEGGDAKETPETADKTSTNAPAAPEPPAETGATKKSNQKTSSK